MGESNNCLENNALKNRSDRASADLYIVLQAAAHVDHQHEVVVVNSIRRMGVHFEAWNKSWKIL